MKQMPKCDVCSQEFEENKLGKSSYLHREKVCSRCLEEEEQFFETVRSKNPQNSLTGFCFDNAANFLAARNKEES